MSGGVVERVEGGEGVGVVDGGEMWRHWSGGEVEGEEGGYVEGGVVEGGEGEVGGANFLPTMSPHVNPSPGIVQMAVIICDVWVRARGASS